EVLFPLAVAVGQPHFAAARDVHGVEEAVDALGDEVGVVHREGPAERGRGNAAEVLAALVQVVGEVADLRVLGLAVEVLEQQLYAGTPGPVGGSLEALDAGGDAGEEVAGEVIATVHDDPLRAETPGRLDVRRQILVGRLGQQRRGFGDVDSGRRVQ